MMGKKIHYSNHYSKVKTITIGGRETEYDVIHVNAYVTSIMNRQAETYSEYESSKLPLKAVKEIYVEGVLRAELIGSKLYQFISGKRDCYDAYVDRQEPKEKDDTLEAKYSSIGIANMSEEELEQMRLRQCGYTEDFVELERKSIYLKSVNSPPPYWTTDNSAGNIDIIYTN
jgi:C-terminal processing protease CtpA/Prc